MEALPTLLPLFAPIHRGQLLRREIVGQFMSLQELPPLTLSANFRAWADMTGGKVIALVLAQHHGVGPFRPRLQGTNPQPVMSHLARCPATLTQPYAPTA